MNVNLFVPINLRVATVLADGYAVTWDLPAAAANAVVTNPGPYPTLNIYGRDAISSSISLLGVISSDAHTFTFAVKSGISEVYLTAELNGTETAASASIFLVSTNIMPEQSLTSIARDEHGIPRAIAVTSDGAVKVTGVTVNNYGGDASAANQVSALTKADAAISATNNVKTAVDTNTSALSSVGLSASTVSALQIVAVNNIPSNFPDVDTTSAVNALNAVVAKDSTLSTVANNTNNALKSTDLALNLGVLTTHSDNVPADFPDAATTAELVTQRANLISIDAATIAAHNELLAGNSIAATNRDFNEAVSLSNVEIALDADTINTKTTETAANTLSALTSIADSNTKLDTLAVLATDLLKTSDLALNLGVLTTHSDNVPIDFPDAASLSALNTINSSVASLGTHRTVELMNGLPAGSNPIGSVTVASTVLPTNAATETTLNASLGLLDTSNTISTNIRNGLAGIAATLDAITDFMADNDQKIVCDELLSVSSSVDFRPEAVIEPTLLSSFSSYVIQVFTYDNLCQVSFFKESALNNSNYYHTMPSYKNMSMFASSILECDMAIAKNIMIRIAGSGSFRVRITGIK